MFDRYPPGGPVDARREGRMAVSVSRVSRIESGDVSTRDALDRYVTAPGGTPSLVADSGDERLRVG